MNSRIFPIKLRVNKILPLLILPLTLSMPAAAVRVKDILKEIASNNLTLKSSGLAMQAADLEDRADNVLPPTAIEYSPFFRNGEPGIASSELIVRQSFDFPTLYRARSKRADEASRAREKSWNAERVRILVDAAAKCNELVFLRRSEEIIGSRCQTGDSILKAYLKKYDMGEATKIDINKIRIANSELERELAENHLQQARIANELAILNGGIPPDISGIAYDMEAADYVLPLSVEEMLNANTEVASAEADVKSAEAEAGLSRQGWLPALSLGYRRNTEFEESSNGFLIGAEFPLFSFGKNKRIADARLSEAMANLENKRMEENMRLSSELERLKGLRKAISTYDSDLILQTIDLYKKSLGAGRINLTDYYTETSILYDYLQTKERLENEFQILLSSFLRDYALD